jgi:homoserine dehydrogenase
VLAQVASVLGSHQIGISSVIQPEGHEGDAVPLVLIIHDAPFNRMQTALNRIRTLACVRAQPNLLWVLS